MSVDLDGALLFHLLSGGKSSVDSVLAKGVRSEHLSKAKHRQAFALIVDQCATDGSVPSAADISGLFGDIVVPTGLELAWIVTHVHRRREFDKIANLTQALTTSLNDNDPLAAKKALLDAAEALRVDPSQSVQVSDIFALGAGVKDEYSINESGKIGIPTPWPSMNSMTMGLYPGTNTWFLARPGTGKTWIMLVLALCAWRHGQEAGKPVRVLIVSPEMPKVQMAERLFTMLAKVGYGSVVGGTLGAYGKQSFFKVIDESAVNKGIFIIDGADGITPERIELAIEQTCADIVIVDSVYKVKWKERAKDRFENMFEGVDTISSWSKRAWSDGRKLCLIAVSQLNRQADQKGGKNMSAVALSDNLSWEADNLFFLEQTEDMKADKRLRLLTEKVRRMSQFTPSVTLNWNMETMDFSELEIAKPKPKFSDHEYGADDF
jgi:replicative DNA helicase